MSWLLCSAAFAEIADPRARVEQVAEQVYVILHDDATDEWPHGNTGVIVGKRSVLVIDSTYLPSRAREDIALIRQITDKPVSLLATTHWHFDHNNGAIAYREAWPDVELLSETDTARWLALNQTWWSKMSTAPDSARRAAVAELEAELAAGGFDAAEEVRRQDVIARRKAELAELESLVVVPPDRLFDGHLKLVFEGIRVEIDERGRANSPADTTFWLPKQGVLFAGDILVQSPLPYVGASWPVPWIGVLDELAAVPAEVIVPGHGPVMRDAEYLRQVRTFFAAVLERVEAQIREGRTLDQIQRDLDIDDLRAAVPVWNDTEAIPPEDWAYTRTTLIERAWRGIRGQG